MSLFGSCRDWSPGRWNALVRELYPAPPILYCNKSIPTVDRLDVGARGESAFSSPEQVTSQIIAALTHPRFGQVSLLPERSLRGWWFAHLIGGSFLREGLAELASLDRAWETSGGGSRGTCVRCPHWGCHLCSRGKDRLGRCLVLSAGCWEEPLAPA